MIVTLPLTSNIDSGSRRFGETPFIVRPPVGMRDFWPGLVTAMARTPRLLRSGQRQGEAMKVQRIPVSKARSPPAISNPGCDRIHCSARVNESDGGIGMPWHVPPSPVRSHSSGRPYRFRKQ